MEHHPKKYQPYYIPETKTKNVFRSHQRLVSSAVIVKTRFIEIQQTSACKRAENYRKTERKTKQFWISRNSSPRTLATTTSARYFHSTPHHFNHNVIKKPPMGRNINPKTKKENHKNKHQYKLQTNPTLPSAQQHPIISFASWFAS